HDQSVGIHRVLAIPGSRHTGFSSCHTPGYVSPWPCGCRNPTPGGVGRQALAGIRWLLAKVPLLHDLPALYRHPVTKFLLAVHVIAAIVAIGPVTVAASMFPPAARKVLEAPGDASALATARLL